MNNLEVITSLGKGDALMCYGIFAELVHQHDHINYYVRDTIYDDVVRLYRSLPTVTIISKCFDELLEMAKDEEKYLVIGLNKPKLSPTLGADTQFYESVGIPLEKKWDNFYFSRNAEREMHLFYDILGLKDGEDFIFIHEDEDRQYLINRKYIPEGIKIINAAHYQSQASLFDWIYTIERADEVHVIFSTFVPLIDLLPIKHDAIFFHNVFDGLYGTRHLPEAQIKLKLNWNIIQYKDPTMNPTRTDIINLLFEKYPQFRNYLEIGVNDPDINFNVIKATFKQGVEPFPVKSNEFVRDTASDEFFNMLTPDQMYDVIFVDGLHTSEQAYRDVQNAKKHLNENGFIVMHDCNPLEESWTVPLEKYAGGAWTGTVYKAFIRLKNENKDWSVFVVNEDCGCGILTPRPILKNKRLTYGIGSSVLSWDKFNEFRDELLQLISFDEYTNILK